MNPIEIYKSFLKHKQHNWHNHNLSIINLAFWILIQDYSLSAQHTFALRWPWYTLSSFPASIDHNLAIIECTTHNCFVMTSVHSHFFSLFHRPQSSRLVRWCCANYRIKTSLKTLLTSRTSVQVEISTC